MILWGFFFRNPPEALSVAELIKPGEHGLIKFRGQSLGFKKKTDQTGCVAIVQNIVVLPYQLSIWSNLQYATPKGFCDQKIAVGQPLVFSHNVGKIGISSELVKSVFKALSRASGVIIRLATLLGRAVRFG
ncbi:MAG: hypothetical protein V3V25_05735 [Paracoccaceae bacterium]